MRRTSRLLQGLVVLAFAVTLPESPGGEMEFQLGQQERIRFLIKTLGSKNAKPPGRGPIVRFSNNYSREAQAVVYLAIQQLLQEGSATFDILIEHFDDPRYSYSYDAPSGVFHMTVGDACHSIVERSVICYEMMIHLISSDQNHVIPWRDSSLKEWWKKNQTRELWEIQIEAIDAQIEYQRAVEYQTAKPIHPLAKKMPEEKFDAKRNENIKILENLRSAISLTRTAYRPTSIDQHFGQMTRLPWPTPSLNN